MIERCTRAFATDLAAFLDDASSPDWRDFHGHLRTCGDCRAEVEAWRSVRAESLKDDAGHPSPDLLIVYADARETLRLDEVASIAQHVMRCAPCRDEVTVFAGVQIHPPAVRAAVNAPTAVAGAAGGAAVGRTSKGLRLRGPSAAGSDSVVGRVIAGLGDLLRRPALAYVMVALLLVPTVVWIDPLSMLRHVDSRRSESLHARDGSDFYAGYADGEHSQTAPLGRSPASVSREAREAASGELPRAAPNVAASAPPSAAPNVPASAPPKRALALRDEESLSSRELSVSRDLADTLVYSSGARLTLPASAARDGKLTLRLALEAEVPEGSSVVGAFRARPPEDVVHVPAGVSELELRVEDAQGRVTWREKVPSGEPREGAVSAVLLRIPVTAVSSGRNSLGLYAPNAAEPIVPPFILELGK